MPVEILVATPINSFGDLIRTCLEDVGQYRVNLVTSGEEALENVRQGHFQLVILDSALTDIPLLSLCNEILDSQKHLRLAIISPEYDRNNPSLGELPPHGYISRPFCIPDMLKTVSQLLGEGDVDQNLPPLSLNPIPDWLQDSKCLEMYLEQQIKPTQALAGIIGVYTPKPDKNSLCVWSGQISAEVAYELLMVVFRYWNKGEETDLMRFIRLADNHKDYLVYATRITGDYILALVYDSRVTLSQVRPQVKDIAQTIATLPPTDLEISQQPAPVVPESGIPNTPSENDQWIPELCAQPVTDQIDPIILSPQREFDDETDLEVFTISENPHSEWHNWQEAPDSTSIPPITEPPVVETPATGPASSSPERNQAIPKADDFFLSSETPIDDLQDTRPTVVSILTSISQLEPVSPALSQLNYSCVLVPRLPQHYLTGGLADHLAQWVHQLCLAYGWRLEGIAVRPEYLQWTVQVAPSISPGNLVRIIRQRTSIHIFNQYTCLRNQNPSGDFWASGYLIISGAQPPSAQLLREYIIQTRKRQGVIK